MFVFGGMNVSDLSSSCHCNLSSSCHCAYHRRVTVTYHRRVTVTYHRRVTVLIIVVSLCRVPWSREGLGLMFPDLPVFALSSVRW